MTQLISFLFRFPWFTACTDKVAPAIYGDPRELTRDEVDF